MACQAISGLACQAKPTPGWQPGAILEPFRGSEYDTLAEFPHFCKVMVTMDIPPIFNLEARSPRGFPHPGAPR